MRLLIALLLPWVLFLTIGRVFAAVICLILQITVIGWLPAAIWAVYALSQYKTDQKISAIRKEQGGVTGEVEEAKAAAKFAFRQIKRVFGMGKAA